MTKAVLAASVSKTRPAVADPCAPLFKSVIGVDRVKIFSPELRKKCARDYFELERLGIFQFARPGPCRPRVIHDPALLMRRQGTYRLAEFYYPILAKPHPGLVKLTQTVLKLQGREKLPLVLETRPHRRYAGLFSRRDMEVRLADTLSIRKPKRQSFGDMNANTLYHEIGHLLMYLLYGKRLPPYRGRSHDPKHRGELLARTSPASAWLEGFANGMGHLDYGSESEIDEWDYRSEEGKAWLELSLKDRLSNEFVIGTILGDYIKSQVPRSVDGVEHVHILFDGESERRFAKIVNTMRTAGMHRDFREFVTDFLKKNPEERERLVPILGKYGLSDILHNAG